MHFKSKGPLQMRRSQLRHFLKGSAADFASFLHASRGCQVADLKDARCSEAGCIDSFVRRCLLWCTDSLRQSRRRSQRL